MNKNFNDFISSLDGNTITEFLNTEGQIKFQLSPEGIAEYSSELLTKSMSISLKLLELYHNWLNSDKQD